jgi:spermidine/putrescine transport system permease protein
MKQLQSTHHKKKKISSHTISIMSVIPLYAFTILFVAGPLIYLVLLSFLQRAQGWGVTNIVTLQNYVDIAEPIYIQTFYESFRLAIISTMSNSPTRSGVL